ncbi:MAG: SPOR domain-containing protein [Bacteroidales bacterium]|jgi:hypothetical protein|nr:SPOR domain-containing protein [Bacteroidales bacterium]MCI2121510.1 SPOR domain-containing protein [Bacteroidales bacterium]MCI2145548.1 SPOR domain-containing protein [Bacteroidales bacterium]
MRQLKPIILTLFVLLAAGCDQVRSSLGKPTSKDLAALRVEMENSRRLADSVASIIADSTAGTDSVTGPEVKVGEAFTSPYYIAGGTFSVLGNARKMVRKFSSDGLKPAITQFVSGYYVVLVAGFDSREEADSVIKLSPYNNYKPEDVCVYKRNQNLIRIE